VASQSPTDREIRAGKRKDITREKGRAEKRKIFLRALGIRENHNTLMRERQGDKNRGGQNGAIGHSAFLEKVRCTPGFNDLWFRGDNYSEKGISVLVPNSEGNAC